MRLPLKPLRHLPRLSTTMPPGILLTVTLVSMLLLFYHLACVSRTIMLRPKDSIRSVPVHGSQRIYSGSLPRSFATATAPVGGLRPCAHRTWEWDSSLIMCNSVVARLPDCKLYDWETAIDNPPERGSRIDQKVSWQSFPPEPFAGSKEVISVLVRMAGNENDAGSI